jgi:hypothetical protein
MSAYIGDVVKNGLVLYLDAANSKSYVSGSNTWFDLSGNNNSGSLTNGPTFSSDVKGNMVFDGTNDHVILARPSIMSGSQVSFCAWVKIISTKDGSIIWLEDGNDARYFSVHLTWGDNSIYFDGGNGTGTSGGFFDRINKSTTATERSGWHYWCFTKNSSTGIMRIYLDGTLWHSGTGQNAPVAAASLGLINKTDGASYVSHHNNAISSIKFYNRELSPAEILENYNATKGRFDTPRVINSVQPRLVTNGLVMSLDAGNRKSYVSGSSTIFDLSGTGNHGTLNNGPTFSSANNGSIVFDGSNDLISTTNSVNNPQTYTIAAWFKTSTGGGKKIIGFESSQVGAGGNYDRMLYIGANNKIYFGQYINGTVVAVSPSTYNDNIWHYIVGTYGSEGTTMRLYVDGVSVATAAASSAQSYTGWWKIGGINLNSWTNGVNGYYTGNIAAAHVYNRGLSASEVLQNYNALKGRFGL